MGVGGAGEAGWVGSEVFSLNGDVASGRETNGGPAAGRRQQSVGAVRRRWMERRCSNCNCSVLLGSDVANEANTKTRYATPPWKRNNWKASLIVNQSSIKKSNFLDEKGSQLRRFE